MDLAQVVPKLLEGISQELGVEAKDFKLVVIANRNQIDSKPLQLIAQCYEGLEWELKPLDDLRNPEPYVEIQLKGDDLLTDPQSKSQGQIACDVNSLFVS